MVKLNSSKAELDFCRLHNLSIETNSSKSTNRKFNDPRQTLKNNVPMTHSKH